MISGGSLENFDMPENMNFLQLDIIRQYSHDPSMEICEKEIEIYYSIDQGFFGSVYLIKESLSPPHNTHFIVNNSFV